MFEPSDNHLVVHWHPPPLRPKKKEDEVNYWLMFYLRYGWRQNIKGPLDLLTHSGRVEWTSV